MDDGDISVSLEEQSAERREAAIRAQRAQRAQPSLAVCEDCDAPIPEARQALGGVTRCTECQEVVERRRGR